MAQATGGVAGVLIGGGVSAALMKRDRRWEFWLPAIGYGVAAVLLIPMQLSSNLTVAILFQILAVGSLGIGASFRVGALSANR